MDALQDRRVFRAGLAAAWAEPDQFEWVTSFLNERGLLTWARRALAMVAASAAMIPAVGLVSERGSLMFLVVQLAGRTLAATMAVCWLIRWPTRRLSLAVAVLGLIGIAIWSQAQRNVEQSVPICMAAAITGGYTAFFHGFRIMIINFTITFMLNAVTAYRLAAVTQALSAARAFWFIWLFNLVVPLSAWAASRAVRTYATRANQDSMTGLLNRRAFTTAVLADLALRASEAADALTIVMVDLDNFKKLNDTHGHIVGDKTLVTVADLLRSHAGERATVCRAGGEEFLIALTGSSSCIRLWAAQVCEQIAALSPPVTASVGTVSVERADAPLPATAEFVEQLINEADYAMYGAKHGGGNRARHKMHELERAHQTKQG